MTTCLAEGRAAVGANIDGGPRRTSRWQNCGFVLDGVLSPPDVGVAATPAVLSWLSILVGWVLLATLLGEPPTVVVVLKVPVGCSFLEVLAGFAEKCDSITVYIDSVNLLGAGCN